MAVLTDPISDFLTRWKNASRARKEEFTAPFSRIKAEIARILQEEGYIWSYEVETGEGHPQIRVKTKTTDGRAVLTDLKRMSSTRDAPICARGRNSQGAQRSWHRHPLHLQRT